MTHQIRICCGGRCKNNFSDDLVKEAKKIIGERTDISVERTCCMGLCEKAPNVKVVNEESHEESIHHKMTPDRIGGIITDLK